MGTAGRLIGVERRGDTLVLKLLRDLRELEFQEIEEEEGEVLRLLASDPSVRHVVVDCGTTDSFGSTALGLFARLGRLVRGRGGRLAFCHPSAHEEDILATVGLAGAWPVFASLDEALAAVSG
jgi:anti-sigma B factor antagonist